MAPLHWAPVQPDGVGATIGTLTLDQRDPLIIVDGQDRFGAIKQAISEDSFLRDEVITIVLFPYTSTRDAQQLFSDLNSEAKKTTRSLEILFDHRDVVNRIVQQVVAQVSVFGERVNLEDASVPTNSSQVFTLAGVYQASKPIMNSAETSGLLPEMKSEDEKLYSEFRVETWEFIASLFPEWGQVARGEIDIRNHRSKFLHWHLGVLSAFGEFVGQTIQYSSEEWRSLVKLGLTHPQNFGWQRDLEQWQGIATAGSLVLPRSSLRLQLRTYLKLRARMPLTESEKAVLGNFPQEVQRSLSG